MRKILILSLCMLLSTSAPAQCGVNMLLKLGAAPSSQLDNDSKYEGDPGVSLSPEVYYNFNNICFGIGFNQLFKRKIKDKGELGSSNIYFAFRPMLKVLENEYVYLIGQAGWGMVNHNFDYKGEDLEDKGGFYYGIGGGVDLHGFIFELLFTSNKATFKSLDSNYSEEDEYTLMTINAGYRFSMSLAKKDKKTEMSEEFEEDESF